MQLYFPADRGYAREVILRAKAAGYTAIVPTIDSTLAYPRDIIAFFEANRGSLDHLLYDVGMDYRIEGSEVHVVKSGYYNVF